MLAARAETRSLIKLSPPPPPSTRGARCRETAAHAQTLHTLHIPPDSGGIGGAQGSSCSLVTYATRYTYIAGTAEREKQATIPTPSATSVTSVTSVASPEPTAASLMQVAPPSAAAERANLSSAEIMQRWSEPPDKSLWSLQVCIASTACGGGRRAGGAVYCLNFMRYFILSIAIIVAIIIVSITTFNGPQRSGSCVWRLTHTASRPRTRIERTCPTNGTPAAGALIPSPCRAPDATIGIGLGLNPASHPADRSFHRQRR